MSVRTNLSRTTTRYPRPHILLAPRARSASTPKPASTRTPTHYARVFSSTSTTQRSPSIIGRFFGARDPPPIHRDPAQVVRDAADTLCVLLRTDPPVRPALLHKPYTDLVTAVLAYRASGPKDPLDLTTAIQPRSQSGSLKSDIASPHLAGDNTSSDPFGYLSTLLSLLTRAAYPHPAELELALRVHADMRQTFEREPSWADNLCAVRAYAMLRRPKEALGLASTMDPAPPADAWAPIACAIALGSGPSAGDEMRTMMRTMAARGVDPPPGAWCALLSAVRPEEVGAVLKALPSEVRDEPRVWGAALEVLVRKRGSEAGEAAGVLKRLLDGGVVDTSAWSALVLYAGRAGGEEDGPYGVVRAFERAGGVPDGVLLRALVSALPLAERTPEVLRRLEGVVGVAGDEHTWGVLVDAALERQEEGGVERVWEAARESGVSLTSASLDRVVGRAEVPVVERLRVYRAVHAAWPAGREVTREKKDEEGVDAWMRREDALSTPGPTVGTYTALLGALTSGRGSGLDKTTASAVAVELLTDMRQRGIKFPQLAQAAQPRSSRPSLSPIAALTVLLMQGAPSHEAAFKMYAYARVVDPSGGGFGAREYKQVMRVFAELRVLRPEEDVWREGGGDNWIDRAAPRGTEVYAPPPAALYYEIMRDMQRAGYEIGVSEYTTILKAYAAVSIPADSDSQLSSVHNGHVLEHIQRMHTLLKLDTNLTPDTTLLNALMNAYGHAGAVDSALAVWDQMKWPGGGGGGGTAVRDNASVSIVLDALGRSGRSSLLRARHMWDTLRRRHGSRLNTNNYTSWVEALCRMGEFSEAERVVFVDMRANARVRPDEKTLRTLVSFAWRVGRQAQVLEDVRREFPGVI